MAANKKPLVQFNASYYRYPTSISRGYWSRYLADAGLSPLENDARERWIRFLGNVYLTTYGRFVSKHLTDSSDADLLHSVIKIHGAFAERFFVREVRERISRNLATPEFDLDEFTLTLSEAWQHDFSGLSKSDAVFRAVESVFDQAFLTLIRENETLRILQVWYQEHAEKRQCKLCRRKFRVIDLPDWIYFGSNGQRWCCFECEILATPTKKQLTKIVPQFIATCGFIPPSSASPIEYSFSSRLKEDKWLEVMAIFAHMGGIDHVKKKFSSWFKALALTEALPAGVMATARGIKCLSLDGHTCHSLDEQRIDNWLYERKLHHIREPMYPTHPDYNPSGRRRADWDVQGTFIEYFGLIGDPKYDAKVDEKIALACEVGIPFIAVYPKDLDTLDDVLAMFLTQIETNGAQD